MRAISDRPDPIRPEIPSTSPGCRLKETSLTIPGWVRPRTSSTGRPAEGGVVRRGNSWSMVRPTISEIIRSMVMADFGDDPTRWPSRSTTTSSQSRITSPRMWLM